MQLLYDEPMRGLGLRPRSTVRPQPLLLWEYCVGATNQSGLSSSQIAICRGLVALLVRYVTASPKPFALILRLDSRRVRRRFSARQESGAARMSADSVGSGIPPQPVAACLSRVARRSSCHDHRVPRERLRWIGSGGGGTYRCAIAFLSKGDFRCARWLWRF